MKRAAVLFVLALAVPAAAQIPPKIEIPYTQFTLPNGLRVILHEDHTVPMATVNMWYHVGSATGAAEAHRIRAPVRASDVHGLGTREAR